LWGTHKRKGDTKDARKGKEMRGEERQGKEMRREDATEKEPVDETAIVAHVGALKELISEPFHFAAPSHRLHNFTTISKAANALISHPASLSTL